MRTIAEHLKEWRLKMNFSQMDAAEILSVAQSTYNDWENNKRKVPFKKWMEVSEITGVDLSSFFNNGDVAEIYTSSIAHRETVDIKRFLIILEENNHHLKETNIHLREQVERLTKENDVLRATGNVG